MQINANMHDDLSFEVLKQVEDEGVEPYAALSERYTKRMVDAGLQLQGFTVGGDAPRFCGGQDLNAGVIRRLDITQRAVDASDGEYVIVRSTGDLAALESGDRRGLLLTIEGSQPCGDDLSMLRTFFNLGLRSVCLVWFKANQVGDGVGEKRLAGLTNFGRQFVNEMNSLGMLIDVAQATEQTFWDVLETSTKPIVASHSNAAGKYAHVRNLTDAQLKALGQAGGLICMTTYPAHISAGIPSIDDYVDQLLYAIDFVGPEHVALGLNIIGGAPELEKKFFQKAKIEQTNLWLDGLEDVDKLPRLRARLQSRGVDPETMSLISGGNIVRVLQDVLPKNPS